MSEAVKKALESLTTIKRIADGPGDWSIWWGTDSRAEASRIDIANRAESAIAALEAEGGEPPSHTDLMVSPESIDEWLKDNPLPEPSPTEEQVERAIGFMGICRCEVCKERMRAALAAVLPDAEGWRPVETAPKDGTVVLVYAPEREGLRSIICTCNYHPDGGWCVDELRFVTHWRPLPAPPKEKADE